MHVRPVTYSDLPGCVDIAFVAFNDDDFHKWLFPRTDAYPASYRAACHRRLRERMVQRGMYGFVCVADDNDVPIKEYAGNKSNGSHEGEIVGYIFYERSGPADDPVTKKWRSNNSSIWCAVERYMCKIEDSYVHRLGLDRTVDRDNMAMFDSIISTFKPYAGIPQHWYIPSLVVSPQWQRRGVGTKLLQWGFNRAREDQEPLCLIASGMGIHLYRRLGFKVISWGVVPGIEDQNGGAICVWEANETWVREAVGDERTGQFASRTRELTGTWTNKALAYIDEQERKAKTGSASKKVGAGLEH